MTVKDLIKLLLECPMDVEVKVSGSLLTEEINDYQQKYLSELISFSGGICGFDTNKIIICMEDTQLN